MRERTFVLGTFAAAIIVWATVLAGSAPAAIPLVTDDTGTQGKGKFQVELFGEYSHDKEDMITSKSCNLSATLTYGLSNPVDISLSIPYQLWRTDDSASVSKEDGFGDIAVEAKWKFAETGNWSFALKPGLTIPTGSDSRGLGAGKTTYHVLFISTFNAGEERFSPEGRRTESPEEKAMHHIEWSVYFNAGYTRNENSVSERTDLWSVSVAGSIEFIEDFYVVADLGTQTNADREWSTHPAYFLAGVIYSPAENIDLGLGLKLGLNRAEADYSASGGLTFRF